MPRLDDHGRALSCFGETGTGQGARKGPGDRRAQREGAGSQEGRGEGHSRCGVCSRDSRVTVTAVWGPVGAESCRTRLQSRHVLWSQHSDFHVTYEETEARGSWETCPRRQAAVRLVRLAGVTNHRNLFLAILEAVVHDPSAGRLDFVLRSLLSACRQLRLLHTPLCARVDSERENGHSRFFS